MLLTKLANIVDGLVVAAAATLDKTELPKSVDVRCRPFVPLASAPFTTVCARQYLDQHALLWSQYDPLQPFSGRGILFVAVIWTCRKRALLSRIPHGNDEQSHGERGKNLVLLTSLPVSSKSLLPKGILRTSARPSTNIAVSNNAIATSFMLAVKLLRRCKSCKR